MFRFCPFLGRVIYFCLCPFPSPTSTCHSKRPPNTGPSEMVAVQRRSHRPQHRTAARRPLSPQLLGTLFFRMTTQLITQMSLSQKRSTWPKTAVFRFDLLLQLHASSQSLPTGGLRLWTVSLLDCLKLQQGGLEVEGNKHLPGGPRDVTFLERGTYFFVVSNILRDRMQFFLCKTTCSKHAAKAASSSAAMCMRGPVTTFGRPLNWIVIAAKMLNGF